MLELEWYENVRNGWTPLCDRCNENISKDNFESNRNQRGVYCESCWNYIHIKKWKCNNCKSSGSLRSENEILLRNCCGNEVSWLK